MRFMRPFTTGVFNRFSRHFAAWLPAFGLVEHRGRKSGKMYRTPLNVFRDGSDWIFALTYGSDVDWVKNVLGSGEATLIKRRSATPLRSPQLFIDERRSVMPFPVRQFLGLLRVSEFLRMTPTR